MPITGVLAGVLAKLSGLGFATKAALAGATAVTTMGLAGGAAGVLPGPAQEVVAAAVSSATPFHFPDADNLAGAVGKAVPAPPAVDVAVPQVPPVSVAAGAKVGVTTGPAGSPPVNANAPAVTPTVPNIVPSLPPISVPPAIGGLVKGLPACVTNLVPTGAGVPDPARLATQVPACIPQVLATAGLPPAVARCVASVLGAIGGASGMSPANLAGIGSLNVSACVPMDTSKCVNNLLGLLATVPGLGSGGLPLLGSIPGLNSVAGCVPLDVTRCITSVTGAVAASATAPKLDLSACMPSVAPLNGIPGLGGALPFLGR